jgi:hypothetical protein
VTLEKDREQLVRSCEEWSVVWRQGREVSWSGYSLLRNSLVKYVIERKIEGRRRRGLRRKQLLDAAEETRSYCKLMEEAPEGIFRKFAL